MNMTKLIGTFTLTAVTAMPLQGHAQDILTGDTRLACEAILCLATASPPGECTPSLTRYFSISLRRLRDTARARANFLKLCPRSNQTAQMQSYLAAQPDNAELANEAQASQQGEPVAPAKTTGKSQ